MVGHFPKHLSFFRKKAGSSGFCEVSDSRVNRWVGLGVEIPCEYKFCGCQAYVDI